MHDQIWVVVGVIPILYESTLSDATFITNGICRLSDTISCTVTEERNGEFKLELEYPFSGVHAEEIEVNRIIKAKSNDTSDHQCFRIASVSPSLDGKRITVKANHISYDLSYYPVAPFSGTFNSVATAILGIFNNSINTLPFENGADYVTGTTYTFDVVQPKSVRACLGGSEGSVLDRFGGEFEWDNRIIKWHEERGSDNGVTIRYGKNLTNFEQETSIANTVCGILPFYSYNGETIYGDIQYSSNYTDFPFLKVIAVDFTDKFMGDDGSTEPTEPTTSELETLATEYISANSIGQPEVCITVEFFPIWQTEDYKDFKDLETVSLCDTVTVIFPELNVSTQAKVVKTVYNTLLEKYNSVELGSIKRTLADTIADISTTGNTVGDGIIESGVDGNWKYIKLGSGLSMCWGYYAVDSVACTTEFGSLYVTGAVSPSMTFPDGVFADGKVINMQMTFHSNTGYPAFVWVAANASASVGATPFRLVRPTSATISGRMEYFYQGWWK